MDACFGVPACPAWCQQGSNEALVLVCLELIKKEYKIYMQDIINSMNTSEQLI